MSASATATNWKSALVSEMSQGFVYGVLMCLGLGIAVTWLALAVAVRERQPHDGDDPV